MSLFWSCQSSAELKFILELFDKYVLNSELKLF